MYRNHMCVCVCARALRVVSIVGHCFLHKILQEVTEMIWGILHIEYTPAGGLFLSYQDMTTASTCTQNALYVDDLTLNAGLK